jgi:hypothetical protein
MRVMRRYANGLSIKYARNDALDIGHKWTQEISGLDQSVSQDNKILRSVMSDIFNRYGGPGSQTVSNKWERDWHTYLVTEKKYIVIMVDGRGTGFSGRKLRNPVRDDLGHWEVVDQIAAARDAAKRVYVDTNRIGIWGWVSENLSDILIYLLLDGGLVESYTDGAPELRRIHDL